MKKTKQNKPNQFKLLMILNWLKQSLAYGIMYIFLLITALFMKAAFADIYFLNPSNQEKIEQTNPNGTNNANKRQPTPNLPAYEHSTYNTYLALHRKSILHTDLPYQTRQDIITYTVKSTDTIISIAEKFMLKPSTVIWANYEILRDNIHNLREGQKLIILPADGAYYQWHQGDDLVSIASFYSVPISNIVKWKGNRLEEVAKDLTAQGNIPSGTYIFIPQGKREYVTRNISRISRDNPSEAQILGDGYCSTTEKGPMGNEKYIYPTKDHYIDGYDYLPEANHFGIDFHGQEGEPVSAVESGIVVYTGWNDWGYGNLVIIDHGKGWQSSYAHLSAFLVQCGNSINQGETIGLLGKSGSTNHPNLHFELLHETLGRVNPWDYLP